jgi:hypothetical protein
MQPMGRQNGPLPPQSRWVLLLTSKTDGTNWAKCLQKHRLHLSSRSVRQPETRLGMTCDVSVVRQRWMLSTTGASADRREIGLLIRPKSERAPSPDSRTYHCTGGALGGHVQLHVASGAGGPSIHQSTPAFGAELHPASRLRRADALPLQVCRLADDLANWEAGRRRLELDPKIGHPSRRTSPNLEGALFLCSPTSSKVAVGDRGSGFSFQVRHRPWRSASEMVGKVW